MNAGERVSQKSTDRVQLHPAIAAIRAAAAGGDATANEYLHGLQARARDARRLAAMLDTVIDRDDTPSQIQDFLTRDQIEESAIQWIEKLDAIGATDEQKNKAIEAAHIILRADLVCASESSGRYGSRETGGRRAVHTRKKYQIDGRLLTVDNARETPEKWKLSPKNIARRIAACSVAWTVGRAATGEQWTAPLGCSCALCPRCLHNRGGQRVRSALPILKSLIYAGYRAVHVTATIRADSGKKHPIILNDRERPSYIAALHAGGATEARKTGRAVPGAALGAKIAEISNVWNTVTNSDRRTRAWWRATVAAGILGTEWTARAQRWTPTGVSYWPRWHVHRHALLILRPEVDPKKWADTWITEWCERADALPAGQCVRQIDGTETQIVSALLETLKYPFKPAELTTAQATETISATTGLHLHQLTGAWHQSSEIGRIARNLATSSDKLATLSDKLATLSESDRHLAQALAHGLASAEIAETDPVCFYRRLKPGESSDRRWMAEIENLEIGDAGTPVAPLTVAYLRDAVRSGATGRILEWRPRARSWSEVTADYAAILAAAESWTGSTERPKIDE